MSDVQLRKKVQLKQKQETPAVTLKRKGEGAPVVTLKAKKSDDAAIVGTVATAVASTAKAASNAITAGTSSAPTANMVGVEAKPAVDSAKAATGATGAGTPSKSVDSKKAGTTGTSSIGNDGKKGGKIWAWILGVAAVAGLAFGGYKFATNNSNNDKSSLFADNETEVVDGQGNTTTGENNVAEPSIGGASDANSESVTGANDGSESNAGANGAVSNNASIEAAGSNSGSTGSGTSNDNSAAANTDAANGAQNPSSTSTGNASAASSNSSDNEQVSNSNGTVKSLTNGVKNSNASAVSPSNATKLAVISSVSNNQAVCLFAFDSSVVGESDVLDKLAASAKSSGRKVVINAYADEIGPYEYNQMLSQKRANAIKNYFIKKGVDAIIITASGKGETTQYANRAENRRADITIQ